MKVYGNYKKKYSWNTEVKAKTKKKKQAWKEIQEEKNVKYRVQYIKKCRQGRIWTLNIVEVWKEYKEEKFRQFKRRRNRMEYMKKRMNE